VHLEIPRIGVDTDLMELGLNADGTVMVPPTEPHALAGWYRYLAVPGEPGPAVILGHVDTYDGPGVFYRLRDLHASDSVIVELADGRSAVFAVDSVRTYPKREFPAEAVYGSTAEPVLRLVTCGGTFDRTRRTYLSNVVVFASLVSAS
jgi:sortase (surface protein transpeptidase)